MYDQYAGAKPRRQNPGRNSVMYVHCNSLEAVRVIAPDANEVVKTYDGGMREAGRW